jgi:hypothetical protein
MKKIILVLVAMLLLCGCDLFKCNCRSCRRKRAIARSERVCNCYKCRKKRAEIARKKICNCAKCREKREEEDNDRRRRNAYFMASQNTIHGAAAIR